MTSITRKLTSNIPAAAAATLALLLAPACDQDFSGPRAGTTSSGSLTFERGMSVASGEHYTLNLIGTSRPKKNDLRNSSRHTIFVPLHGETRIDLDEGADFVVTDGNATDGYGGFELPDPDPDNDGVTSYSVYARAHGKPGGSATMFTCYSDAEGEWCSTEQVVFTSSGGDAGFTEVSRELLSVCADTDDEPGCDSREFLFDDENADYWWTYDNDGLRVAQLRFVPTASEIGLDP